MDILNLLLIVTYVNGSCGFEYRPADTVSQPLVVEDKFANCRWQLVTLPAALELDDLRHPRFDQRYAGLSEAELPRTECLKDTVNRMLPYWHSTIAPVVNTGKRLIICAHGNSLRALVKYLDNVPDDVIPELNIPTGIPLVYELNQDLRPIRHFYLGDPEAVRKAAEAVANQGKAK